MFAAVKQLAFVELVCAMTIAGAGSAQEIGQPGSFPLASCKGWSATLTELQGKDTSNATMRGVLTTADAKEYCERDPGGETVVHGGRKTLADCIAGVLNDARSTVPPGTEVSASADCKRGTIVSASEKQYQLIRVEREASDADLTWETRQIRRHFGS